MANYTSSGGAAFGGMGARGAVLKAREKWFVKEMMSDVRLTMHQRVRTATIFLYAKVRKNLNVPVTYSEGPRGGKIVNRSRPGEYPRRETNTLRKAITFRTVLFSRLQSRGYVSVDLDQAPYGKDLEESKYLNRFFLLRTYYENYHVLMKMMTGPITRFSKMKGASVGVEAGINV